MRVDLDGVEDPIRARDLARSRAVLRSALSLLTPRHNSTSTQVAEEGKPSVWVVNGFYPALRAQFEHEREGAEVRAIQRRQEGKINNFLESIDK